MSVCGVCFVIQYCKCVPGLVAYLQSGPVNCCDHPLVLVVPQAVHALEDQRAALRYEVRRSKEEAAAAAAAAVAAATETAASARLAEENYSQQLRLLSLHVAETHEKNKETQRELEDLLKHKILCGRCGVWNPLSEIPFPRVQSTNMTN